jgi:hypothetical protein
MDKFVEKYIKVEKNNLIAKTPLDIVIDKEEHKKLIDDGEYYILQGIVDIINPKQGEQWTSPFLFDISIPKTGSIDIAKKVITIHFVEGDVIMMAEYKTIESDIAAIKGVLENRVKYLTRDIASQHKTAWSLFESAIGAIPSVYTEIILSEMHRDPDNPSSPFRLCKLKDYKDSLAVDMKKAVHLRSNIYRSIAHGYTKDGIAYAVASEQSNNRDAILNNIIGADENE